MTIPSRPAPAPPIARGLNAAAGANVSLEQLRLQLQQERQTQHQNGGEQKLTIKLPPPPSGRYGSGGFTSNNSLQQKNLNNNNNSNNNNYNENGSSITRKFPHANIRYAPVTSWDDIPFEPASNGNAKKVPPPRPPPPKVQVIGKKPTSASAPPQSVNILNNIFSRKKVIKAPSLHSHQQSKSGRLTPAGVYGASSGTYNISQSSTSSTSQINNSTYNSSNNFNMWPSSSAFTSTSTSHFTSTTTSTSTTSHNQDTPQLISFDSPPSSPTFTQKSNSDCVSVDSFSSDSNFSSPQNGSVSQPESGFEDDFTARSHSTTSPLDPWETLDAFSSEPSVYGSTATTIGTAPVRNLSIINTRIQSTNDNPLCNGKSLLPPAPSLNMPTIIKPKISQKPKAPKPPLLIKNSATLNKGSIFGSNLPTPPSPPMPKCAPPPAPNGVSLLDVISGKADALELGATASYDFDASGPAYGIALYDFDGLEDGDLSFRENEKIYLIEQVSEEWYRGRKRSGCEGIFPINYLDIKIPLQLPQTASTTSYNSSNFNMQQSTQSTQHTTPCYGIPKVKCLYNFPAEVDGDLPLKENDLVTILYKINEDWLYGEVDGRQGQFPSNFLEFVPNNIPMP